MNFEPQKFFIGLVDFFSVLLPGALFTFFFGEAFGQAFLGDRLSQLGSTERWIALLLASYLFGHFIFLVGAGVLDDFVYDPIRKATRTEQIKRLADGKALRSLAWLRHVLASLARWTIKPDSDRALAAAVRIKEVSLAKADKRAINAFQWSKAWLRLKHPEALEGVLRFEADSKFFRSLVVLLLMLVPWSLRLHEWRATGISVLLLVLAFWRYVEQRAKATTQAYWFVIAAAEGDATSESLPSPNAATHAGGVVLRKDPDGSNKVLLVRASKNANEWVLPKGHIETNETPACAAVREVLEEAGIWARVVQDLEVQTLPASGDAQIRVHFFRMAYEAPATIKEQHDADQLTLNESLKRGPEWFTIDEAIKRATFTETKQLLTQLQ